MQTIELTLFADYHQFYLQVLAVADHVVGIGTVRNMNVPVQIVVDAQLPDLDPSEWDRINRAALVCDTGRIVVAGCTDYFPNANRIEVAPGAYDVFVACRNLESLSEDGREGGDSYHIFLAPQRDGA